MATPAVRTASPGILMLALLLTATSAPAAKRPAATSTDTHPQPAKHGQEVRDGGDTKLRCA